MTDDEKVQQAVDALLDYRRHRAQQTTGVNAMLCVAECIRAMADGRFADAVDYAVRTTTLAAALEMEPRQASEHLRQAVATRVRKCEECGTRCMTYNLGTGCPYCGGALVEEGGRRDD